jgi:hypothetical protein
MKAQRTYPVWIAAALLMLLMVSLASYITCYIVRGEKWVLSDMIIRRYSTTFEASLFQPAAKIEGFVTGEFVVARDLLPIGLKPQPGVYRERPVYDPEL